MIAALDDASALLLARVLYWTSPLALLLWAAALVQRLRARRLRPGGLLARHAPGLLVAAVVTAAALWASPPRMRMQFDETSLCGTAQNMHLGRTAMMGVAAVPDGRGGLELTDWNLDKRPPLFPFLTSLVHDLTGYRVANAFAVNGACLFLLLAFVAAVARDWIGRRAAVAAPLLLGAVPLLVAAGTSAGFELLAVLLLAVVVVAAIEYAAAPTPAGFAWLLASGLLYAQSRYESLLAFLLVLGLACWRARRVEPGRLGRALLLAAPLLLVPVVVLLWHASDPGFYLEAAGRQLLSPANAAAHVGPLALAWFTPLLENAFPGALGAVAFGAWVAWLVQGRGTFADALVVAPVALLTAIVLLWFYGDVREPTARRLYLPAAALAAVGVLPLLAMFRGRAFAVALVALAAALLAMRLVAVRSGELLPPHRVARLLDQVDLVLENVPHDPNRTVWVTTVSQYLIVHGRAAIPPRAFDQREAAVGEADVLVLTSPLDSLLAGWFGDPQELLRARTADPLGSARDPDSDAEIAVYRLRR